MDYRSIINNFKNKKVLVIGDLILDKYVFGISSRISLEAPIPIVNYSNTEYHLGGASNVAKNVTKLGAKTYLVGIIGKDNNGRIIQRLLNKTGINSENIIKDKSKPTTLKTRIVSNNQQLLRIDEECSSEISSDTQDQLLDKLTEIIPSIKPDGIIISDYNKGTVTNKVSIKTIKLAKKFRALVAVDPKGKDFTKYKGANVITPNRREAEIACGHPISDKATLAKTLRRLQNDTESGGVIITKGREGISFIKDKKISHVPTFEKEICDVTGAGDTFISAFTLSVLCSDSWQSAAQIANAASSIVIGKLGTSSLTQNQLLHSLEKGSPSRLKIQNVKDLSIIITERKKRGEKIVFTNGCFDILHTGHIKILRESIKHGDLLVVALNSDESIRRYKSNNKPVVSEADRATIISSFDFVDYVVIFDEDTPLNTIKKLKPDVITKGGDYKKDQVVGKTFVERCGGEVKIIPLEKNRSTSHIIDKIRKS